MEDVLLLLKGIAANLNGLSQAEGEFKWEREGILLLEENLMKAIEMLEQKE